MVKRSFTTRGFMRHAPNALLREFFEKRDELSDFNWDALNGESKIEPLYRAFIEMPDDQRKIVEGIFRQVHDLSHEAGIKTLVAEGEGQFHKLKLRPHLDKLKSFEEKALWVQIHHAAVVKVASFFQHADHFSETSWKSRTGLSGLTPRVLVEELQSLADEISKFHIDTYGCGKHGKVENYLRGDRYHYYFVYIEDFPDVYTGFDIAGEFERRLHQPAIEIVFRYDPIDGLLETHAKGVKDVVERLQEIYCEKILDCDLPPASKNEEPYSLKRLFELNFELNTDSVDRLDHARVRKIRLNVRNYVTRRLLLESLNEGDVSEVKNMFHDYLNAKQINANSVKLAWAEFEFEFLPEAGQRRGKKVIFQLTDAGHANLDKQSDQHRDMVVRYLKRWQIFRV